MSRGNSHVVNRLLKVATTFTLASARDGSIWLCSGCLALTASSMTLAVTSRAFEVFHSKRRFRIDSNQNDHLLNLTPTSKSLTCADTFDASCDDLQCLPLMGFIRLGTSPPLFKPSCCPLPKRRNAPLVNSLPREFIVFRPHAFSASRRLTPAPGHRFISP